MSDMVGNLLFGMFLVLITAPVIGILVALFTGKEEHHSSKKHSH